MRRHVVAFSDVRRLGEYLQIGFPVQSAHVATLQRVDVIDLVANACLLSQSRGFCVDCFDSLMIGP